MKALLISFLITTSAQAATPLWDGPQAEKHVGVGALAGQMFGVTAKYFESGRRAVVAGAGYSLGDYVVLYADYLFQFPKAFSGSGGFLSKVRPYVGPGAEYSYLVTGSKADKSFYSYLVNPDIWGGVAARLTGGAEWLPSNTLGVFLEITPAFGFFPDIFWNLRGGGGVRYYF